MDVQESLALLGGLSASQFMRRHWQKKPLLVRQALTDTSGLPTRRALFAMTKAEDVESRLITRTGSSWTMQTGPFSRRDFPPLTQPGWTLLVQGVDLRDQAVHALLAQFRFVPDARLDDVMISWASERGGVGPHFDSYDVFLLQTSGRRRWRIGRQDDLTLRDGVPLKILKKFLAEEEFVLDAGDMLYLPPGYAHEGVAELAIDQKGRSVDCMTASIGFRAPARTELVSQLLGRLADFDEEAAAPRLYRDPAQPATEKPAQVPKVLLDFASAGVTRLLTQPQALACALGEYLTEPKPSIFFATGQPPIDRSEFAGSAVALDSKTRMMYDSWHVFINGESLRASGADAVLLRQLADQRRLSAAQIRRASPAALGVLHDWREAGWLVVE